VQKESSDALATIASRMIGQDVIEENRTALHRAIIDSRHPDELIAEIKTILQPYFDDAASLAGSVMSQATK
jgi:hypothetical protein